MNKPLPPLFENVDAPNHFRRETFVEPQQNSDSDDRQIQEIARLSNMVDEAVRDHDQLLGE